MSEEKKINDKKATMPKVGIHEAKYLLLGSIGSLVMVALVLTGLFVLGGEHHSGKDLLRDGKGLAETRSNMMPMRGKLKFQNTISGKVTAVDGKTVTIDKDGDTLKIAITDNTRFPATSETDVKIGDMIWIVGDKDSAGTIQAERIVIER